MELPFAFFVDGNGPRVLVQPIDKLPAGMSFPDLHGLESFVSVADEHGATGILMLVVTLPCPSDATRMIEVIPLGPIGEPLARRHQPVDLLHRLHIYPIFIAI